MTSPTEYREALLTAEALARNVQIRDQPSKSGRVEKDSRATKSLKGSQGAAGASSSAPQDTLQPCFLLGPVLPLPLGSPGGGGRT